jgi:mxaA protein
MPGARCAACRPGAAAVQQIHGALNKTMGEVVFEEDIGRFVAAHPRFADVRDDLAVFFRQSRLAFFGDAAPGQVDAGWLQAFCRRCRDAEKGAA